MKRLCLMIWVFGLILSWVGTVSAAGPAEGWIAFASNQDGDADIYAVRPDGTGLRQLMNLPGHQGMPQWSPDSSKIAYTVEVEAQIWVYDWFTETNTKIYDADDYGGQYYVVQPAWSPDGSKILFREDASYNNPHITLINADGTGRAIVPVESGYVDCPSWSPTGTAFVYIRRNGGTASNDLWIYDFTATGDILNGVNHRLTAGAGSESTTKVEPDWTPSEKIVLYWGHNLAIIDPGQSPNWRDPPISDALDPHVTFLTDDASYPSLRYGGPSWSPNVSQIVYWRQSGGELDLWIMDTSGGNRHPLIATSYMETSPDWGNPTPKPPPPTVYYVDAVNGDDNNNGLSPETAFATIYKGIDTAEDGCKVFVYPGLYQEEVDFKGKAITIQGVATKAGIPVIENPGDFAVSFYNGEGPDSILKNFVVRDSFMAVFIAGSSPTIKNLNIIGNTYGIEAYAGSQPDISNCIFWNNSDSDLFGCEARYSWVQSDIEPQPIEGLVAYWSFDEGSGNIAHDDSGNNHTGIVYGATWADGTSGKAMSFDGADDYVDIPGTSNLNPPTFTLSAWIMYINYNEDSLVVGKHYSGGIGGYFIGVYYDKAMFWFSDEPPVRLHTLETYRDGQWHHLAGVYDGARQYLYVDGRLAAQRDKIYSYFSSQNIHIGAIVEGQKYNAFNGLIDEVSIYNRALSAEQINQLYQNALDDSPLFADSANSDYHLLSQRGRYWPEHDVWVLDKVTSPCVDGGDPSDDLADEPMPNGGRIDMGAFGGTPFASMSEIPWLDGDINHDGIVNLIDFAMLAENWLR